MDWEITTMFVNGVHTYIHTQHIEYGSNTSHMTLIYKLQITITTA